MPNKRRVAWGGWKLAIQAFVLAVLLAVRHFKNLLEFEKLFSRGDQSGNLWRKEKRNLSPLQSLNLAKGFPKIQALEVSKG